jgi:hypothetical protein
MNTRPANRTSRPGDQVQDVLSGDASELMPGGHFDVLMGNGVIQPKKKKSS